MDRFVVRRKRKNEESVDNAVRRQREGDKSQTQFISAGHLQQMMDNRTALLKIFSTLKALARQGVPIRGSHNDENSNFMTIVKTRAEDVGELKSWLQRDGHRWLHHDSENEILDLMATTVLTTIICNS